LVEKQASSGEDGDWLEIPPLVAPGDTSMDPTALTPEQHAEAQRIYQILRERTDADLRQLAQFLASKPDHQLLGATEFEVRDRVHRLGAQALTTALAERKKRGITGQVPAARAARKRPSSSAGRAKRS
jgi:hypothetical protein